jgi:hypothetical protein
MRRFERFVCAAVVAALPALARAQSQSDAPAQGGATPPPAASDTEAEKKKLEEEISKELGGAQAKPPATAAPSAGAPGVGAEQPGQAPPTPQGGTGGNPLARLLLMPDISAIASFAGVYDSYDVARLSPDRGDLFGKKGQPTFLLQEVELGLQSVVDPYFRADVFISFSDSGVDVEEAYATTLSLPASLQLRAGKFFSPFGRMNQQHPHVWEFVDGPLARYRLLAQDTFSGPGAEVSWLAPTPWFMQLQLAAQTTVPFDGLSPELTGVGRLLQYFTISESTSLGLGLSAARRREGAPGAFRDLGGADFYLRVRPVAGRSYLAAQGEVYLRKFRDVPVAGGAPGETMTSSLENGWWLQAFWRQTAFVGYGVRYEEAPAAGASAPGRERRASAVLDWYPSEFSRVALQASYDRLPGGLGGFEGLLHFEFAMGAHGAHPF